MPDSILVTLSSNNPTLSKSGRQPFSITLRATTNDDESVVIDPFASLLDTHMASYYHDGFTFSDVISGEMAKRSDLRVQYQTQEHRTPDSVALVPSVRSLHPFMVSHHLKCSIRTDPEGHENRDSELQRAFDSLADETAGLVIGRRYEIGLGQGRTTVRWWMAGDSVDEVFRSRQALDGIAASDTLPLNLVNTVVVEVVE